MNRELTYGPGARGFALARLQAALVALDIKVAGGADGKYGTGTAHAVAELQRRRLMPTTVPGFAGLREFVAAGTFWPDEFERCLMLTAAFEGTYFTKAEGPNETGDNAGVTYGIVGFTSYNGEVQSLLRDVFTRDEWTATNLAREYFTPIDWTRLNTAVRPGIGNGTFAAFALDNGSVRRSVKEFLRRLGESTAMQTRQLEIARERYWQLAEKQAVELFDGDDAGNPSVRAKALCFDVAVQDGGFHHDEIEDLKEHWERDGSLSEREQMFVAIDRLKQRLIAKGSSSVEDVMSRKRTIASGMGTVHGDTYNVERWGL